MNDAAYICRFCGQASAIPSLNVLHEQRCEMRPWEGDK